MDTMEKDEENKEALDLLVRYNEHYEKEKAKLPYEMNLLDCVKPNENAHSRMLECLFKYQNKEGKYTLLQSFVQRLGGEFAEITVYRPRITCEKGHVDLLVVEKDKYAIIFENKIHNAKDQKEQLANYIKKASKEVGSKNKVYVVYLPLSSGKEPEEQSWGKDENDDIKNNRYRLARFDEEVLPWLRDTAPKVVDEQDKLVGTSIDYYKHHLEGLLRLRETDKRIDKVMTEYLKEELLQRKEASGHERIVEDTLEQAKSLCDSLRRLRMQTYKENYLVSLCDNWLSPEDLIEHYEGNFPHIGIRLNYNGDEKKSYAVLLEYGVSKSEYCIGLRKHLQRDAKHTEVKQLVQKLKTVGRMSNEWWYCYSIVSEKEAYGAFEKLLTEVKRKLKED